MRDTVSGLGGTLDQKIQELYFKSRSATYLLVLSPIFKLLTPVISVSNSTTGLICTSNEIHYIQILYKFQVLSET